MQKYDVEFKRNILWKLALGKEYQLNSLILGVAIHLLKINKEHSFNCC